ncbi:prolyl oligopeptidase family serine peptidase [Sphingomonas psychrotolerans]|uniref:Prolyl oligopeptidase family serine peptidase n=1 Tax=Sphingomonas psychrotolerans TaxID=1327635 RepID=A0ABU3NAL3_9SPHN|nr:prolyl oligopeptidase family serine peptidase [Sphingomonas psychrotolerans]MDT8760929.1 prolyl oligopeptidase family serine peptidase [Sphingomonas psychrotolerans]
MANEIRLSRRRLLEGAALGCGIGLVAPAAGAINGARWLNLRPPLAPVRTHLIKQLGRERDDPYSWLKYVPSHGTRSYDTLPPMIRDQLNAEADYANAMLAPLNAERERLLAAMLRRAGGGVAEPPLRRGAWRYASRVPEGGEHAVHYRIDANGKEQLLLDEAQRARGHAYYRTTGHQPSADHRYFAWAEDVVGNDRHRLCVLDTQTGNVTVPVETDAYGYGGLVFAPSSAWLFWIWRDARNRPTRLYRSPAAGGEQVLVYEESDPAIFMQVGRTAADGFVRLTLSGPDVAEVRLIPATDETAAPRIVRARVRGVAYDIDEWRGALLMVTDEGGAFDRKIVQLDPRTLQTGATLVPHRPGVPILSVVPFETALVRLERDNGLHRIVVRQSDGSERTIAFPDAAYALELPDGQDYRAPTVRIVHQSPVQPRHWLDMDLATGRQRLVAAERLNGFNPNDYVVERLSAKASDGVEVPITLVSRHDAPKDGRTPLLLYGYGAYGISSDPLFSLPATALIDKGWRYAIAHVRGGSEKGRRWFLDGRLFAKRNSMTDFVACAQTLCRSGYTAPKRVVAFGLSAGGLLVGGAMNLAPELWAGVIAKVPFVDMLNTMSDADHPLVPLFRPDWGDPLADPKAYDYIASISPYENVRRAAYPPLLCTAGLKDDRVSYWEPAKLVANVRRRSTSGNPAILLINPDAGHQSSGDQRAEFDEMARFWAFAQNCVV